MDSAYKIEVLHYLNPHLMWVERKGEQRIILEQIGIFGLLPLNSSINLENCKVFKIKAGEWAPVVHSALTDFLQRNNDVYFEAIHIDRRSSIFDDNIHKFGDIFTIQNNGLKFYLSTHLINHGHGYLNEAEFFQKLSTGNIKTKLSIPVTNQVIMAIETYMKTHDPSTKRNKAIATNTSVFRAIKDMGQALTAKNLELHNRNQDYGRMGNVSKIIEQKTNDFLLYKVENEEPLGRATRRLKQTFSDVSNSETSDPLSKNDSSNSHKPKVTKTRSAKETLQIIQKDADVKKTIFSRSASNNSSVCNINEDLEVDCDNQDTHKDDYCKSKDINKDTQEDIYCKSKNKQPQKDNTYNRKRKPYYIAYGPPMSDRHTYKVVEKYDDEDNLAAIDMKPENQDIVQVDSKIDIKSTKIQKLNNVIGDRNVEVSGYKKIAEDNIIGSITNVGNSDKISNLATKFTEISMRPKIDDNLGDRDQQIKSLRLKMYQSKNLGLINKKSLAHTQNQDINVVNTDKNNVKDKMFVSKNNVKIKQSTTDACENENKSLESNEVKVNTENKLPVDSCMQKKLKLLKDVTVTVTKVKNYQPNTDTEEEVEIQKIKEKLDSEYKMIDLTRKSDTIKTTFKVERNVNPFKNLELNKSVFVDKLVSPILMVHTKNDSLVLPKSNLRDIPFRSDVYSALKSLQVKEPSRLQSISWPYILKGHSIFMISPAGSGKTIGYIPAVCNLVTDYVVEIDSVGPICIIVCATARSVNDITHLCKLFLGLDEKVLACFHGIDSLALTSAVLNGCDILVCTPPMLYKLLVADLGVDLRRLATLVFDDCERLTLVYESELKMIQYQVKEMLKKRSNKKLRVQYIMASRTWCDYMKPLAKKIPDTIVAIAAFQECVLYCKSSTSVEFVLKEKKLISVTEFLNTIDKSKRTVVVCRSDDEVLLLEKALSKNNTVFACNSTMTLHDLYNLNVAWVNYQETLTGPILICCDGNLTHLNIVDASYLVHYSMPELFSMFCKRFSVLNENYTSIFSEKKNDVRIKILVEENNIEQLPKILNFIKRCTSEVPLVLEEMSRRVLEQKDFAKAEKLVPLCDTMMTLSECSDIWNCKERHAILKGYDEPSDWMPRDGTITFKILHYHTAVSYSASLLSHITNTDTIKYPKSYSMLSIKMGMFYSRESNRKSHGVPKVGDICAVALKQNLYARCQVLKIQSYHKGNPHGILVKMVDEEQLETVRDIHLYYLPVELRNIETYTVKVRLANIGPEDKDVTFSDLAKNQLKSITDTDEQLYMRGKVVLTVGNTIFVDTLEACQNLTTLKKTVVKHNFKDTLNELHGKINANHIVKLKELCKVGGLDIPLDEIPIIKSKKEQRNYRWAHIPKDEVVSVIFSYAVNPSKFFVKLSKFQKCNNLLISDIQKYVTDNPKPLESYEVGDIVLAKFPDDKTYARARIEKILSNDEVTCFFVDSGDILEIPINKLRYIPNNLIEQIPFQVIECRLIGVEPPTEKWNEFSNNWLCDNCFEDSEGETKLLYLKYFTKEMAEATGGSKYGVLLVDTNTDKDIVINKLMIELNLAQGKPDELEYLNETLERVTEVSEASDDDNDWEKPKVTNDNYVIPFTQPKESTSNKHIPLRNLLQPIKSVPLVDENISLDDCDFNIDDDLAKAFGLNQIINPKMFNTSTSDESNKDTSEDENVTIDKLRRKLSRQDKYLSLKSSGENKSQEEIKANELNNNISVIVDNKVEKGVKFENTDTSDDVNICDVGEIKNKSKNNEKMNYTNELDVVDGNTIPKTESKETKKTVVQNTNPATFKLEKPQETRRRGSAEDPNIIMDDIQELSASKPNILKLFALTSPGIMKTRVHVQTDKQSDIKSNTISTDKQNESNPDTISYSSKTSLDSDDLSLANVSQDCGQKVVCGSHEETSRKPKLIWRQNKKSVIIKIQLIGVKTYVLDIHARSLIFFCHHDDVLYEFQLELYGIINTKTSRHANKGQYIQVNLEKIIKKDWFNLTTNNKGKKWIVYDVDTIDKTVSSDEETAPNDEILKVLKEDYEKDQLDSDDDDDFLDDMHAARITTV